MSQMKKITAILIGTATGGMVLFFCLNLLFVGDDRMSMSKEIAEYMERVQIPQQELTGQFLDVLQRPVPELQLAAQVVSVGRKIDLMEEILLRYDGQAWSTCSKQENIGVFILDVSDEQGNGVRVADYDTTQTQEEITGKVCYDVERKWLQFHQTGIYRIRLRIVDQNGAVVEKTASIGVEV